MQNWFFRAFLVTTAVAIGSGVAHAQESYCCNKTTGQFTPLPESECRIKPNNVPMTDLLGQPGKFADMCASLTQMNTMTLQSLRQSREMFQAQLANLPSQAQEQIRGALAKLDEQERILMNLGEGDPGDLEPDGTDTAGGAQANSGDGQGSGSADDGPPDLPDMPDLSNMLDLANMPDLGSLMGNMPSLPPGVDLSNIPGMPEGYDLSGLMGGPNSTPIPQPDCCNIETRQFAGAMEPAVCRAQGDAYIPDIAENLEATEVCRIEQDSSGGGSSAALWDDEEHEENLGNAGMEQWVDENRPRGFGIPFNVTRDMFPEATAEFRTVFRDPDAHTGAYSLRLKNFDLTEIMPPEGRAAAIAVLGRPPVAPAGVNTCRDNCMQGNANLDAVATLDVPEVKTHVCGVYKGYIGPGDQLAIQVFNTDLAIGTPTEGITRSAADWRKFALQLQAPRGQLPKSGWFGASIQIQGAGGLMAGGWGNDPNTEVKVDSLHMCDPIGMTAFHPKVITGGPAVKIPDDEEETKGVQTFVNLDNDDEDGFFDFDDKDKEVAEDDELVLMRMYAPKDTRGEAVFRAPDGLGDVYRLWADENKSEPFEDANQEPQNIQGFLRSGIREDVIERRVWIEALKPSQSAGDMEFEFVFMNQAENGRERTDKIALTALQVERIEFEGKGNGADPKKPDELDEDPNWPSSFSGAKSWRVFPGKSWNAPDGDPNDKVDVKVTLNVEPTREVMVYFKSFDVDDPTADDDEVDREDVAEDNRAKAPASKTGKLPNGADIYPFPMNKQEDRFEFEVTMQPGDNFRLVASGDEDALEALENDDTALAASNPRNTARIVDKHVFEETEDATKAQHRRAQQRVSDVLTVWRKLHIEMDTMSAVKGNEYEAHIVSYENLEPKPNSTALETKVWLTKTIYELLPDTAKDGRIHGIKGSFLNGTANIDPWLTSNAYDILDNSDSTDERDWLLLRYPASWGAMDISFKRRKIVFRDDDATKEHAPVPTLDTSRVVDAFAPAYILPTWDEIPNSRDVITFRLNSPSDKATDLRSYYEFENSQYEADPQLWTIYALNAFQGMMTEDGDGDGEGSIAGESDNSPLNNDGQGLHIYQESGRELVQEKQGNAQQPAAGWSMADVLPHEIGHLFTGDHGDEGLMWDPQDPRNQGLPDKRTEEFGAKSLSRIRDQEHP